MAKQASKTPQVEALAGMAPLGIDRPRDRVEHRLTGGPGVKCVANGNTWAESEVSEAPPVAKVDEPLPPRTPDVRALGIVALENIVQQRDGQTTPEMLDAVRAELAYRRPSRKVRALAAVLGVKAGWARAPKGGE